MDESGASRWRKDHQWEDRRERMRKHTTQLRGSAGHNAGYHGANRGPVRRWNSFHGGGGGGGGTGNFNDGVGNGSVVTKACHEPFRAVPKAVQALRSESVDRAPRVQPPPPPAFPRRRFSVWWVLVGITLRRKNSIELRRSISVYTSVIVFVTGVTGKNEWMWIYCDIFSRKKFRARKKCRANCAESIWLQVSFFK